MDNYHIKWNKFSEIKKNIYIIIIKENLMLYDIYYQWYVKNIDIFNKAFDKFVQLKAQTKI